MSFLRSAAGQALGEHCRMQAAAQPNGALPPHFLLHASAAAHHHDEAAPSADPACKRLPASVGLMRFPTAAAKLDAWQHAQPHWAPCSAGGADATGRRSAAPILLPHMDDLEEEIALLGYEKAMVAGASAGVTEHVFMFPVDTVKTRMQALQQPDGPRYTSVFGTAARIIREEGVRRLYRGFSATVAGAIPSHAVHFATYENLKHRLGGNEAGHHPLIIGLSGGVATMAHDAIVTPLDVVKQRLQVHHSPYSGVLQCIRTVFAREGLRAFYASYPTTVAMNVPFQTVQFAAYESFKIFFTEEEDDHGVVEEFAAGGAAGALAGFVSTPLDVVKTRLQTQIVPPGQQRLGALDMARQIHLSEGARGFMRGATARMLYYVPSAAICWTTYETAKRVLKDAW